MTSFWEMVINAIASGIGVSIGTYFANKHLIKNLEKVVNKINRRVKNGKKL